MEKLLIDNIKNNIKDKSYFNIIKNNNGCIAGGALTSLLTDKKINDYDIFFTNEKQLDDTIISFSKDDNIKCIYQTDNAYTYKCYDDILQIIIMKDFFNKNLNEIINSFDFTINMAIYDLYNDLLITNKNFYIDNMQRKLIFNDSTKYPITSLNRAIKYINRGYELSIYEQVKIALKVNILDLSDKDKMKKQLQGIDTNSFRPVIDFLIENDNKKLAKNI